MFDSLVLEQHLSVILHNLCKQSEYLTFVRYFIAKQHNSDAEAKWRQTNSTTAIWTVQVQVSNNECRQRKVKCSRLSIDFSLAKIGTHWNADACGLSMRKLALNAQQFIAVWELRKKEHSLFALSALISQRVNAANKRNLNAQQ